MLSWSKSLVKICMSSRDWSISSFVLTFNSVSRMKAFIFWIRSHEEFRSRNHYLVWQSHHFSFFLLFIPSVLLKPNNLSEYLTWQVFLKAFCWHHSRFLSSGCSSFSCRRLTWWDLERFYRDLITLRVIIFYPSSWLPPFSLLSFQLCHHHHSSFAPLCTLLSAFRSVSLNISGLP